MTKMNSSSEESNPSSDKDHDYLLRCSNTDSKDMKRVLYPSNILTPPKTLKNK